MKADDLFTWCDSNSNKKVWTIINLFPFTSKIAIISQFYCASRYGSLFIGIVFAFFYNAEKYK